MSNWEIYKSDKQANSLEESLIRDIIYSSNISSFNQDDQSFIYATIEREFNVNKDSIIVVGSAKLGFSINSGKNFDQVFLETKINSKKSDVDISIVNQELFFNLMKECWLLTSHYNNHTKWVVREPDYFCETCFHPNSDTITNPDYVKLEGIVCEKHIQNNKDSLRKLRNDKTSFLQYMGRGWFRKDLAPLEFEFEGAERCMKILQQKFNRKFSYAVYADSQFLEDFQRQSIRKFLKSKR